MLATWLSDLSRKFYFWKMLASIKKYGVMSPVIVSRDGTILDGNNRVAAALQLGIQVPIVRLPCDVEWVDPAALKISCPVDLTTAAVNDDAQTPVGVCDECGLADGGHAPGCSRWQTMSAYEILRGQKDAILAKQKARGDALMKQLEGTLMGKLRQTEAERDAARERGSDFG